MVKKQLAALSCLLFVVAMVACAWMMCGAMSDFNGRCPFCCADTLEAQERAIDRAPIGVKSDRIMGMKGGLMVSVRQMRMWMAGNRNGTDDLSDAQIIKLPHPYQAGNVPSKLSVVPQDMVMNMTMLGLMYAQSSSVTLMGTGVFMSKSMDLFTYQGMVPMSGGMMMDRHQLGSFTTSSSALASISLSGLIKLYEGDTSQAHAQLGIQRSFGVNDATGEVLTPMNMRQRMILPYDMQIGDGSASVISALTYVAQDDGWGYGGQVKFRNVIANNGWNFGDTLSLTGWVQREWVRETALSFRATHHRQDAINGRDTAIITPVQTANPANYGGSVTELGIGVNQLFDIFPGSHADRIGVELTYPIHQDLNGPQMKSGVSIQLGYQRSFN